MSSVSYALQRKGPKLLTITYSEGYHNLRVLFKDKLLATYQTPQELSLAEVMLPDETRLCLDLKHSPFSGSSLYINHDGFPLPGSPGDKVTNIYIAAAVTFVIAGLSALISVLVYSLHKGSAWADEQALAVVLLFIASIAFAVMGISIWRKSKAALLGAVGLYGFILVVFVWGSSVGLWSFGPLSVIAVPALLVLLGIQVQGFSGFAAWEREDRALIRQLNSAHSMRVIGQQAPVMPQHSTVLPTAPSVSLPREMNSAAPVPMAIAFGSFRLYRLRRGEPQRLLIRYGAGFTDVHVLLDGQEIAVFPRLYDQTMRDAEVRLPDNSLLTIGVITEGLFNKSRLSVRRNGLALPGSPDDHSRRHTIAAVTLTCVTVLTMLFALQMYAETPNPINEERFVLGFMAVASIIYVVLTGFVWFKSRVALGIAIALYSLDLLALFLPGDEGMWWSAIVMHIIILILLARGFKGIDAAEAQNYLHATLPSPGVLAPMPNWMPKHPAQTAHTANVEPGNRWEEFVKSRQ